MNRFLAMLLSLIDPNQSPFLTPPAFNALRRNLRRVLGHAGYAYEVLFDTADDSSFVFTGNVWRTFAPTRDLTAADAASDIEILYCRNYGTASAPAVMWAKVEMDALEFRNLPVNTAAAGGALAPCATGIGPRLQANTQGTYFAHTVFYLARQTVGATPVWKVTCDHLDNYHRLIVRLKTP